MMKNMEAIHVKILIRFLKINKTFGAINLVWLTAIEYVLY